MTPYLKRTFFIDAAIVTLLVVLAFVLAPGVAIVGIAALLVLILGGISFIFGEVRARRRHRRQTAERQAIAGGQTAYGPPWVASGRPGPGRAEDEPLDEPTVKRVPASRRPQARRKPLQ